MRILTCYLPPTDGTAKVAGYDVFEAPLEVKKRVGYIPETPPLYIDMDVQTYLDFAAKIKVSPASRARRASTTRSRSAASATSARR
jgi:ABC-2 type transport system ATP-binding protein